MKDTTYNGWTNYATWRINLEMFDAGNWDFMDADDLRQFAEDYIEQSSTGFARDYAMAFLSEVNWQEIANYLHDDETEEETEE
jgi:hypothetical protein